MGESLRNEGRNLLLSKTKRWGNMFSPLPSGSTDRPTDLNQSFCGPTDALKFKHFRFLNSSEYRLDG